MQYCIKHLLMKCTATTEISNIMALTCHNHKLSQYYICCLLMMKLYFSINTNWAVFETK